MNTLLPDLRYVLRQRGRSPALIAVMVVTLALGIGAATAIFSVLDAVLATPLAAAGPWAAWGAGNRVALPRLRVPDRHRHVRSLTVQKRFSAAG